MKGILNSLSHTNPILIIITIISKVLDFLTNRIVIIIVRKELSQCIKAHDFKGVMLNILYHKLRRSCFS
jgi:hypothetical protein